MITPNRRTGPPLNNATLSILLPTAC